MWPAFQLYPFLKHDVHILYTKAIWGMREILYAERLHALNTLFVANQRSYADMVLVYKCVHRLVNISTADVGLVPLISNTRGCGYCLKQKRPYNKTCGNLFPFTAVSQ